MSRFAEDIVTVMYLVGALLFVVLFGWLAIVTDDTSRRVALVLAALGIATIAGTVAYLWRGLRRDQRRWDEEDGRTPNG